MKDIPLYLSILFVGITFVSIFIFYLAVHKNKLILRALLAWLAIQAALGLNYFYTNTSQVPPRFSLLILPPLILIVMVFILKPGRLWLKSIDLKWLTYMHIIRIPVELTLLGLFLAHVVPELMTFEGKNLDILSGITAPFIAYFGIVKKRLSPMMMLIWNLICLGLLANIVTLAILSAPFPFQQFAFDQPNLAVLYFPFVWLPCCVVPLVLFAHVTAISHYGNLVFFNYNKM